MESLLKDAKRVMCLFSCGAASAVATKITLKKIELLQEEYGKAPPVVIMNNYIQEEHPDNQRFLLECQKWFEHEIIVVKDTQYNSSIYEVFERNRFISGRHGAPCTRILKREIRREWMQDGDVIVAGFTYDERGRYDRFSESNPDHPVYAPLIDYCFTKENCLYTLKNVAGIALPAMYIKGYENNNCIGCVKGGKGYWNKVKIDFPETFERMAELEQRLGENAFLFAPPPAGGRRQSLRDLKPWSGNYKNEPSISCSIFCETHEELIN